MDKDIMERMKSKIKINEDTGCFDWTGSKDKDGYGHIQIEGRPHRAHKVMWEQCMGKVRKGFCVCHDCPSGDNPSCVNLEHLWVGTVEENNKDRADKGRNRNQSGTKNNMTKLTEWEAKSIIDMRLKMKGNQPTKAIRHLAILFGVSESCIKGVWYGTNWRHLR